ncbi:MAG: flagellar hook-associated protein FlgK, partial [Oscillospiraceae bacterium]|nr:flagellar hook-associated protein FlgK [Oscillospiraceae bacterium]
SQVEYETGVYNATDIMLTSVETSRSEVMDVSMDEEGINMMNYQKWYNAISRMITTLDEALDKLINGTGRVGL